MVTRVREAYGPHERHVGDWWLPDAGGRLPTVVLVHGGFWRAVGPVPRGRGGRRPRRPADPMSLLPTGVPTVCVHGEADDPVPVTQSEAYVAGAGGAARLVRLPGGHREHVDPASAEVAALREALAVL